MSTYGTTAETRFQGVANSSIVLLCGSYTSPDIELVTWKRVPSDGPFLSHFAADGVTSPLDHDKRFSFQDTTNLAISSLQQSDNGTYECSISSPTLSSDLKYTVDLMVLGISK